MKIDLRCYLFFLLLVPIGHASSRPLMAQDALSQLSNQEVRIGPVQFTENINATPVALRASLFASFAVQNGKLDSRARLLLDLSDIQPKAGLLIDTSSLPNHDCGLRISIHSVSLTAEGDAALFRFKGRAEFWGCLPLIDPIASQGFTARIAARLALQGDRRTLAVNLSLPDVDFKGLAGYLGIGDLGNLLFDELIDGFRSKLQIDPIPKELVAYQPRIVAAKFFPDYGRLAAEVQLELTADSDALTKLAQSLVNPHP